MGCDAVTEPQDRPVRVKDCTGSGWVCVCKPICSASGWKMGYWEVPCCRSFLEMSVCSTNRIV